MKAQVLKGSKQEIAETAIRITGEVREAVVFVEEPAGPTAEASREDIFAEMQPFMVRAGGADYSREALYDRTSGE